MKIIHKTLVGSRLWGLHREDSDFDYRGIIITPLKEKLYQSAGNKHRKTVTTDTTYYEFDHFIKLLQAGNPTILETLWGTPLFSHLPMFSPYFIIDFDRMVGSAKGFAVSQIKQLARQTDPKRRGKAITSGLTGLSMIEMVSAQDRWIDPDPETVAQWRSFRNGEQLDLAEEMLRMYVDMDYEHLRWGHFTSDVEYIKEYLYDTYMAYDMIEGVPLER